MDSLDSERLSAEQRAQGRGAEELAHDLAEASARLSDLSGETAEAVDQQRERIQQEVLTASDEAAQSLSEGNRRAALEKGTAVHSTLSQVAASLQGALQSMQQGFGEQVAAGLRNAAMQLLDCSMLEEDLANRAPAAGKGSPLSREQVEISEAVRSVARGSEKTTQMRGEALSASTTWEETRKPWLVATCSYRARTSRFSTSLRLAR